MFLLNLAVISTIVVSNVWNCFCDTGNRNKTDDLNTSKHLTRYHFSEGFVYRTLFVAMVISMSLSMVCILRMYYSSRRLKRMKTSKGLNGLKEEPKYDFLPTNAINDSNAEKKALYALNDSEDEELTIFDSSERLMR